MLRALALAVLLLAGRAEAAEEIRAYDVEVEIGRDGALEVTETIRVTVEGDRIKRGIYRDFPVEQREDDGRVSLTTFELLEVARNGEPEPHTVTREGAYVRTRIGRAEQFLPAPSEQVYRIRYRTEGQLRAVDGLHELYWNVTGDLWEFPILSATVEVRLPEPVAIVRHAAYTGPRGATGSDVEVMQAADGIYRARTTAPLGRREGFTVAIAWPPGVVEVPPVVYGVPGLGSMHAPPMTLGGRRLGPLAAALGTLAGALALLLGWVRVGRDPPGGAVYPRFEPPAELSPAAMRYVRRQGFDPRCLTAAILSMAVKGAVRIVERPDPGLFRRRAYTLEPRGEQGRALSEGERAAYRALFPTATPLELTSDRANGGRMDRARAELKSKLWDEHYGASFRRNTLYTLGGVAFGVAVSVLLIGVAERWNPLPLVQWGGAAVLAAFLVYAAGFLWFGLDDLVHGRLLGWRRLLKVLPFAISWAAFAFVAHGTSSVGFGPLLGLADPPMLAAGGAFGAVAGLFHFLMAAPTKAGRKLMDAIEGFRLYLRTAEEERLGILNPPERTPELFERLLPHAVALGLAHEWSEKFAHVLSAAAMPDWYHGSGRFDADRMEREFSHAVSSTTTPPSRGSGGSGGGGSSGGGGGGGGGGGW